MIRPVVYVEVGRDVGGTCSIGLRAVPVPTLEEYQELQKRVEDLEMRLAKICHPAGVYIFDA